jgi:phosphohistidine phosphatase
MKLLLLRHGIAVEFGTPGYERDSERPLTPEGRRKTRAVARALAALGVSPDVILASPLVRAHQTAEIVAGAMKLNKRLHICEQLASGGDAKRLIAEINRHHASAELVMLVGHEPDLSSLTSLLLTGSASGAAMEFKKGGVCLLEADELQASKCARLLWLAPPKLLI